jgi:CelD/BcsL family acetyltransferase involved in cellulose biosynthesis
MYSGWIAAWVRWFGSGKLTVLSARDGDLLIGVLPVTGRRGVVSAPANWHTPSFDALSANADATAQLVRSALSARPYRLDLAFVYRDSPQLEICRRAAESIGYLTTSRVIERSPFVPVETDWRTYEATIPSRKLSKVRRFRRRLEERGSVSIELERGDDNLELLLSQGFAIEASGWKGEQGTAITSSPQTKGFYEEIARWAVGRGWLRLWFLRLDGRPIAFAFCLEHGGRHYELKVGFNAEYAAFGPGVLLTRARLEHCFDTGLLSYEFLGQPERHKLDWTDELRDLVRLQAFARSPAGLASRVAWTHGRRLAVYLRGLRSRGR